MMKLYGALCGDPSLKPVFLSSILEHIAYMVDEFSKVYIEECLKPHLEKSSRSFMLLLMNYVYERHSRNLWQTTRFLRKPIKKKIKLAYQVQSQRFHLHFSNKKMKHFNRIQMNPSKRKKGRQRRVNK